MSKMEREYFREFEQISTTVMKKDRTKNIYYLCDDVLGVIFQYLEEIELFKIGFVTRRFRDVSSKSFLWVDKIWPETFPHLGTDLEPNRKYIVSRFSNLRGMWMEQEFEKYRNSLSMLKRLRTDELIRVFEYLSDNELFSLGWISHRLRNISCSDKLWNKRRNPNFSEVNKKYCQEYGERFEPHNVRDEYFYQVSLERRKQVKDVKKLYKKEWRSREYLLKTLAFCNDVYYPSVHNSTPCLLFCVVMFLSFLLFFEFYFYETFPRFLLWVGLIVSVSALPLGFCLHCGVPGNVATRYFCNEILLIVSQYYGNIVETKNITDLQRRHLFEILRDRGIKGPEGIPRQVQNNYEREVGIVKYGITLLVLQGSMMSSLLFFVFQYLLFGGVSTQYSIWSSVGIIGPFTFLSLLTCFCYILLSRPSQFNFSSVIYFSCTNLICFVFLLMTILGGLWVLAQEVWDIAIVQSNYYFVVPTVSFIFLSVVIFFLMYGFIRIFQLVVRSKGDLIRFSEVYHFPWWDVFVTLTTFLFLVSFTCFWLIYFLYVMRKYPSNDDDDDEKEIFDDTHQRFCWLFLPIFLFSMAMLCVTCSLCITMIVVRRVYSSPTRRMRKYKSIFFPEGGGETDFFQYYRENKENNVKYQEVLTKEMNDSGKEFFGIWGRLREIERRKRYESSHDLNETWDFVDVLELEEIEESDGRGDDDFDNNSDGEEDDDDILM